jgi:hypothetical protein
MAFTSHEEIAASEAGYDLKTNAAEYSVFHRLHAETGTDDASSAVTYVQINIANSGSSYPGRASATLKKISVRREKDSSDPWTWIATLVYADPDSDDEKDKKKRDENEKETDDPIEWKPKVSLKTHNYSRPVTKAKYEGGYKGEAHAILQGAGDPAQEAQPYRWVPVNSAFSIIGPLEMDDHYYTLSVERNEISLDMDKLRPNVINKEEFQISYKGIAKTVKRRCAKIDSVSASSEVVYRKDILQGGVLNTQYYISCSISIEIIDSPGRDWTHENADQGFSARALAGDPDGKGGTFASIGQGLPIPPGGAPQRRLTDINGDPISEPALLDGNGQPINFGGTGGAALGPVYGKWLAYAEIDFKTEIPKLLRGIVQ